MTQYFDSRGQMVRLGKKLGSGGEGAVFELQGDARHVAKIYHRPVSTDASEKLRLMTSLATEELTRVAALPVATLSGTKSGPVTGIVMPRVRGQSEIHALYSPAHRKLQFPDKDWSFLIHVAMNLAAVFDTLHCRSLVIGDVNQGNVLVSPQGTICLIDCDSFQVEANGRVFPCEVGVAHFTPPELQGKSFQGVHRTVNHDLFGLATLIFHLLCMGRHPYAGRFVGQGDPPPIEKAIEQYRYAYGRSSESLQTVPPPQTLLLPAVMPVLASLFERAFGRGSDQEHARPRATEWHAALRDLKSQLKPCSADLGHKYPNYLGTCPWCELERDGAPNFFASVTAHLVDRREGELTASLDSLWRPLEELVRAAKGCVIEKVSFATLQVTPAPIPENIDQNQAFAQLIGRVALISLILLGLTWWNALLFDISVAFSIGFGLWWLVLSRLYGIGTEKRRREQRLKNAIARLRSLELEAVGEFEAARTQFRKTFESLELTRAEIEGLWPRYTADLDALNLQRERRQLDAFLQSHSIREATIPLIGDWRKSTLASFGIETAYDISELRVMSIDGFGPTYTSALLDWKRSIQKKFKFRPRQQLPNVDRNTILARYLRKREELEDVLASGRWSLELVFSQLQDLRSRFQQRLEAAAWEAKQAEADVMVVSW